MYVAGILTNRYAIRCTGTCARLPESRPIVNTQIRRLDFRKMHYTCIIWLSHQNVSKFKLTESRYFQGATLGPGPESKCINISRLGNLGSLF